MFQTTYFLGLPDPDPLLFVRIRIRTLLLLQSWSRLRKNKGFIIFSRNVTGPGHRVQGNIWEEAQAFLCRPVRLAPG